MPSNIKNYWNKPLPLAEPTSPGIDITINKVTYRGSSLKGEHWKKSKIVIGKIIPLFALSVALAPITIPLFCSTGVYRKLGRWMRQVHYNHTLDSIVVIASKNISTLPIPPIKTNSIAKEPSNIANSSKTSSESSSSSSSSSSGEKYTCPITLEPFEKPYILLEDGFTYEEVDITEWLDDNPNMSPLIRQIPSATLYPNKAALQKHPICPLTKQPFKEAYYCIEDGHTYEKDAIIKWFKKTTKGQLPPLCFTSPSGKYGLNGLTLYPNKILFKANLPADQEPIKLRVDVSKLHATFENNLRCIYDSEIRDLILKWTQKQDQRIEILEEIHERRKALGLDVLQTTSFEYVDLSELDLSHMQLNSLCQKFAQIKGANFEGTIFTNCYFAGANLLNCNMRNTTFINSSFSHNRTSFFKTDMHKAVFNLKCTIEKADTWGIVKTRDGFKDELIARGALNVDTVTFQDDDDID